jgi:predicted transcriptional regulator
MAVVWGAGAEEITARAVADELDQYAYTTVATVMNRLSRKGVLRRRMESHVTYFAAVESPADRAASAMREALASGGEPVTTLRIFIDSIGPDERAALRKVLNRFPEG